MTTTTNAIDRGVPPSTPAQQPDDTGDVVPFGAHTSELVLWAYEARQARQIAQALAKTSFVPQSLRGKPDDITAAILAGQELGLKPMATLRSIDVIQGTPGLRAHAQRALLQSHGHKVQLIESTDKVCRMRGRRKGDTDADWQEVEWDLKRADQLGLLGKSEWKKQPKTMLVARATGEICRLVASDVLHGMPYNAEELRDSADLGEEAPRVTAAEVLAQVRPASSLPRPDAAVEPIAAEVVEPDADAPPAMGPTPEQRTEIVSLLNSADIKRTDDRLRYVSEAIDREVSNLKELTPQEVEILLDKLRRFAEQSEPGAGGAS